jgi:hypothetical protein
MSPDTLQLGRAQEGQLLMSRADHDRLVTVSKETVRQWIIRAKSWRQERGSGRSIRGGTAGPVWNFGRAQDRLVKGIRVARVKSPEKANQYLEREYLVWWEREMTAEAANADDAYRGAASRWPTPSPGSRTFWEDHPPSHSLQMRSGRLLLDRAGRHPCPSPLRRHPQIKMHSREPWAKRGHFYFASEGIFLLCLDSGRETLCRRKPS